MRNWTMTAAAAAVSVLTLAAIRCEARAGVSGSGNGGGGSRNTTQELEAVIEFQAEKIREQAEEIERLKARVKELETELAHGGGNGETHMIDEFPAKAPDRPEKTDFGWIEGKRTKDQKAYRREEYEAAMVKWKADIKALDEKIWDMLKKMQGEKITAKVRVSKIIPEKNGYRLHTLTGNGRALVFDVFIEDDAVTRFTPGETVITFTGTIEKSEHLDGGGAIQFWINNAKYVVEN